MVKKIFIQLLLISTVSFGQKYNFIKFDVKQGLSLSQISDIDTYEDGRLVISTFGGGINVYNGQDFKITTTIDGLINSTVYSTVIQNNNRIWVGTEKGLSCIDKSGIKNLNRQSGLPSNNIWSLATGKDNVLWIGTENGLAKFENGEIKIIDNELVKGKRIWQVFVDSKGNLWIARVGSLVFYDYLSEEFVELESYKQLGTIYSFAETENGEFWLGTDNGLFKSDGVEFEHYTVKDGLTNNLVWKVFIDSKGTLWLATNEGVTKYSDGQFTRLKNSEGLTNYKVWTVFEDFETNLWFGTDEGLYKLTDQSFKMFTEVDGKSIDAWTIIEKEKNEYLIGSELEGVVKFKDGKFTPINIGNVKVRGLSTLFIDKGKNLWLASDKGIFRYSQDNLINPTAQFTNVSSVTTHILEDEYGKLIFGTLNDGTIEFNGKDFNSITISQTERETVFYHLIDSEKRLWAATSYGLQILSDDSIYVPKGFEPLINYSFLNMVEDAQGFIWAGSYEGGLICFDSKNIENPEFDTVSVNHGLSNEAIMASTFDADGNLWVSTNTGINRIDLNEYHKSQTKNVLAFGLGDGFTGSEGYQNGILTDSNNNILISTIDGLIVFDPSKVKKNSESPFVQITTLKIVDSEFVEQIITQSSVEILANSFLELAHDNNSFTIEFVGISLTNPNKVKYSYRIDGGNWITPNLESRVHLSGLSTGKHTFEVNAYNNNGIKSRNTARLNFEIVAPFWMKVWFQILAVFVFIGIIFLFYLYRLNRMDKINKDLEERIEEKIKYEAQLKKSEKELRSAKEAAEKSDKLKTEFLAQMSHEIRTPINTILSYTNLLKEDVMEKVDESLKEGFSTIDHSSHRLIRTIDSILNMSQLQTGNFELFKKKLNLCKILRDLHLELETLAQQKNINLNLNVDDTECFVVADQYTITQLFANIIDNAIKYTNKGKVQIDLNTLPDKKVVVEISDTGIGMSDEFQRKIFDPFAQEEQGYSRKYKGTGLGLALVKKYAELNNVKLTFNSKKGDGTTFFIEFKSKSK